MTGPKQKWESSSGSCLPFPEALVIIITSHRDMYLTGLLGALNVEHMAWLNGKFPTRCIDLGHSQRMPIFGLADMKI